MKNKYQFEDVVEYIGVTGGLHGDEYTKFLYSLEFLDQLCVNSSTFFAFFDLANMSFQYVSPSVQSVLGYSPDLILKDGIDMVFKNFYPGTNLVQMAIHKEMKGIFDQSGKKEKTNLVFTFNIKFKNANGKFVSLLQRNRILKVDKNGKPLLVLVICSLVEDYIFGDKHTLVVTKIANGKTKNIFSKNFYPEFINGVLTRREIEVWEMMHNGTSTKEIAEKLHLKVNTVFTHRKKIHKKLKNNKLVLKDNIGLN